MGGKCKTNPVKSRGVMGTIREHSINILPEIRNTTGTSVEVERKLNKYLHQVPINQAVSDMWGNRPPTERAWLTRLAPEEPGPWPGSKNTKT